METKKAQLGTDLKLIAYGGGIIPDDNGRWVVDLATLQMKEKLPLLRSHDPNAIVGFIDGITAVDSVQAVGHILETDEGHDVKTLIDQGFPFEFSIQIQSPVEQISPGVEMDINGRKLTGPFKLYRGAVLREVSVTALGKDGSTRLAASLDGKIISSVQIINTEEVSQTVSNDETEIRSTEMPDTKVTMTAEALEEQYSDVVAQVVKASLDEKTPQIIEQAQDAERNRFSELMETFPDQMEFVQACYLSGDSVDEAKVKYGAVAKDEIAKRQLKIESLQAELAEQKKISTISFAGVEGKKAEKEEDKKQLTEDETLKAEYEGDEKIQAEFSTVESFMSYRKHIGK